MPKIIFMGSPPLAATILERLCQAGLTPSLVVTQVAKAAGRGKNLQPTAVEILAVAQGLDLIATDNVNTPEIVDKMRAVAPDLILVAAFGQLLKDPILTMPRLFCLNVHASLLPAYRGAAPLQWGIWNGDKTTGITIQKMVKKLDAGDILVQEAFPIEPDWTSVELLEKAAVVGGECLLRAVKLVESGKFTLVPQDPKAATYAPKIDRVHAVIDWARPADAIRNQIRALQPWPVAETRLGKDRLKIFKATVEPDPSGTVPGTIRTDSKQFLTVKCGDSKALSLTEIQLENRKRLDIKDFLRGYRDSFPHKTMGDENHTV
jgi:methionyl-tRNA formyltransferase